MPSHQARREPLPRGYQFGDAGKVYGEGMTLRQYMAAESRDARSSFDSPEEKAVAGALLDAIDRQTKRHRIGETVRVTVKRRDGTTYRGWNVIEGEQH